MRAFARSSAALCVRRVHMWRQLCDRENCRVSLSFASAAVNRERIPFYKIKQKKKMSEKRYVQNVKPSLNLFILREFVFYFLLLLLRLCWPFAFVEQIISIKWTSRPIIHWRRRRRWTWTWTFRRVINELWPERSWSEANNAIRRRASRLNFGARQWQRQQFRCSTVRPFCMTSFVVCVCRLSNMLAVDQTLTVVCLFSLNFFLRIVRASRLWSVHRLGYLSLAKISEHDST